VRKGIAADALRETEWHVNINQDFFLLYAFLHFSKKFAGLTWGHDPKLMRHEKVRLVLGVG
jgi:hypothetical protein